MKVLFVRHGKSLANANGTIGTPDTPLAEEGIIQAQITGKDLRSENITQILCSPYIRAQQTAEIIAGELGIALDSIHLLPELRERHMGTLEGLPKQHPSAFFHQNDTDYGFESHADLIARMSTAIEQIRTFASKTKGTTVVVGHACSGLFLAEIARGKSNFETFVFGEQLNNAEYIELISA